MIIRVFTSLDLCLLGSHVAFSLFGFDMDSGVDECAILDLSMHAIIMMRSEKPYRLREPVAVDTETICVFEILGSCSISEQEH